MTVSSFFPGHIRLRGEMIKDKDIFDAFEKAASSHKAVSKIERNERTGSLCIEYDANALPLSKFEIFKEDLPELKKTFRCLYCGHGRKGNNHRKNFRALGKIKKRIKSSFSCGLYVS